MDSTIVNVFVFVFLRFIFVLFCEMQPFGKVPVIRDGDYVLFGMIKLLTSFLWLTFCIIFCVSSC